MNDQKKTCKHQAGDIVISEDSEEVYLISAIGMRKCLVMVISANGGSHEFERDISRVNEYHQHVSHQDIPGIYDWKFNKWIQDSGYKKSSVVNIWMKNKVSFILTDLHFEYIKTFVTSK